MLLQLAPARADSLGAALDSVFAAREYRWEAREDPFGVVRRLWLALREWLFALREQNPELFRYFVWGLVATLVLILAHAAWVTFSTVRAAARRDGRTVDLSLPSVRDARWYAQEATRLAGEGRFAEAIQADFLRLILELDARQVTRFHPSKTPGEYVREAALRDEKRVALRDLVRSLYAYAFARIPCDRDAFDAWRAQAVADRFVERVA
jgi:hypothetical protein